MCARDRQPTYHTHQAKNLIIEYTLVLRLLTSSYALVIECDVKFINKLLILYNFNNVNMKSSYAHTLVAGANKLHEWSAEEREI